MGVKPLPYFLLFCLCFIVGNAINPKQLEAPVDDPLQAHVNYHNYNPIPSTPHNPWISGPNRKKYQFHVGQQSWLAAREICLAENSDLVTITSQEELEWILSHYKPQLKQFRERQLQIGLLVDNSNIDSSNIYNWKWVDNSRFDSDLFRWAPGEPSDHAGGRERCALLNINRRTIEDVDCDLSGNALNFYRFVCERSHQHHLKHEELNNPLWKKLEDILVFFGISQSSGAPNNETELVGSDTPQLDDEDYMDQMAKLNTTEAPKLQEGSGEEPKPTEQKSTSEWTADPTEADELLPKTSSGEKSAKTLNDGPPFPSLSLPAVHGTKLAEPTDADLLANKELEKLDRNEAKESIQDSTSDPLLQRTTKADPLTHLADTLESEMSKEGGKTIGDKMHQLERIINAVQTMLEDEDKENSTTSAQVVTTTEAIEPKTEGLEIVQLIEKNNRELVDQNLLEPGTPREQIETSFNLESDFEHAKVEALAHPDTNSGDFLLLNKKEELIGCGAKNLGGTKPPSVPSTTHAPIINKTEQVNKLLESLRGVLSNSSNDVLSNLLADGDNPQAILTNLQKIQQQPSTTTKSPEETKKIHKRVEYEILKSLEELREVESQEFVDLKSNTHELQGIASGVEPPTERLITLTPAVLTAHQTLNNETTEAKPTSEALKKTAQDEGFDVNVMLHLPKDEPKNNEHKSTKSTIPESEEEEENNISKSLREKLQQKQKQAPSELQKSDEQEGSGVLLSSSEEENSMEKLNKEVTASIFPKPDFALIKNKKLEAQSKKSLAVEKQKVDKAFDQLNSKFDSSSVLERIKQSEAQRSQSQNGTIEETQTLRPEDEPTAKILEEIFDEWATLLGRR